MADVDRLMLGVCAELDVPLRTGQAKNLRSLLRAAEALRLWWDAENFGAPPLKAYDRAKARILGRSSG